MGSNPLRPSPEVRCLSPCFPTGRPLRVLREQPRKRGAWAGSDLRPEPGAQRRLIGEPDKIEQSIAGRRHRECPRSQRVAAAFDRPSGAFELLSTNLSCNSTVVVRTSLPQFRSRRCDLRHMAAASLDRIQARPLRVTNSHVNRGLRPSPVYFRIFFMIFRKYAILGRFPISCGPAPQKEIEHGCGRSAR
jgi:hypothetical protein